MPSSPRFILTVLFWGMMQEFPAGAQPGTAALHFNRIQYNKLHWQVFVAPQAHIYFPRGNDSLCAAVSRALPHAIAAIKNRMGAGPAGTPAIIIHPSVQALYESNIGGRSEAVYPFPTFVKTGHRLLLAFNGSYRDLETQLKEVLVLSVWENQMGSTGGATSLKKSVVAEKIPYWFKEGAVSWFANAWPLEKEEALRAVFAHDSPAWFGDLVNANAPLAGNALCHYLQQEYGRGAVRTLYFHLRKKGSLQRAMRLLAKQPFDSVYNQCFAFYGRRFAYEPVTPTTAQGNAIRPVPETWSVDSARKAFWTEKDGKRKVYLYDRGTNKIRRVFTYVLPPWMSSPGADLYPLLRWTKDGDLLITASQKGSLKTTVIRSSGRKGETVKFPLLDGATSVLQQDRDRYLLSAWEAGQPDLVSYRISQRKYTPLTNDFVSESEPVLSPAGDILYAFESQRDSIAQDGPAAWKTGIGIVQAGKTKEIVGDTAEYMSWARPLPVNEGQITAATTRNGRWETVMIGGNGDKIHPAGTESAWLREYNAAIRDRQQEDSVARAGRDTTVSFLSGVFAPSLSKQERARRTDSARKAARFQPAKAFPYALQFYSAYFTARVNNDYLINRYQPYLAYQGSFEVPEPGGLAAGGLSDLFENHHFAIGYRLPAGTEGSDFFVRYENEVRRLDWGLAFFRKVETLKPDPARAWVDEEGRQYPNAAKVKTHWYELSLRYPLSYRTDIALRSSIRKDKTIFSATELYSLKFKPIESLWSVNAFAFHHNGLRPTIPDLYRGFDAVAGLDVFKGFTQGEQALSGATARLAWHKPICHFITLVARAQSGYSGGDARVLYNLGGVDNNLTIRVDSSIHFPQEAPYAFQTLITPLRGYNQNTVYGASFALLNADIYFPLFPFLIPLETNFSAINNLQLGVFGDVGNAWEQYSGAPARSDQWRWSYGFSGRTRLAGYPLRVDVAWPVGFSNAPVWYLSLKL